MGHVREPRRLFRVEVIPTDLAQGLIVPGDKVVVHRLEARVRAEARGSSFGARRRRLESRLRRLGGAYGGTSAPTPYVTMARSMGSRNTMTVVIFGKTPVGGPQHVCSSGILCLHTREGALTDGSESSSQDAERLALR